MLIGYARVSSNDQNLDIQETALLAVGAEKIFAEKVSGTSTAHRTQLRTAIDFCREGDVLIVTRLDRIARSSVDLHNIVAALLAKGAAFRCTDQDAVNTTTSSGKLMLGMLAAVAEFETALRRERQMEGISRAKAAGVYKGRRATIPACRVIELHAQGMRPVDIARELGIGRASVYRLLPLPRAI